MEPALQIISSTGVLPSAIVLKSEEALPLGTALLKGGLPALELRFNEVTEEVLQILSSNLPEIIPGVLVRTTEEAERSVRAGARFISSVAFNAKIVDTCQALKIDILPGASSPRDFEESLALGVTTTRFFSTGCSGETGVLPIFADVWPEMRFIVVEEVTPESLRHCPLPPNVDALCTGRVTERALIESKDFEEISRRAEEFLFAIHNFSLLHIGINNAKEEDAIAAAQKLAFLFGFKLRERPNSMFADPGFELMKTPDFGKNGHVAIGVNDIPRALTFLHRKGISVISGTERYNDDGSMRRVYLDLEISGFAFHLRSYK